MTMDPRTNSVEYHSVNASGHRYRERFSLPDDIPYTAHSLQEFLLEGPIDPIAEPAHEDVDDIGLRVEVVFPDVGQDHRFRHDVPCVSYQIFEQRELARTQLDHGSPPRHLSRQQIQRQIINGERRRLRSAARATHERLDTGEQ